MKYAPLLNLRTHSPAPAPATMRFRFGPPAAPKRPARSRRTARRPAPLLQSIWASLARLLDSAERALR